MTPLGHSSTVVYSNEKKDCPALHNFIASARRNGQRTEIIGLPVSGKAVNMCTESFLVRIRVAMEPSYYEVCCLYALVTTIFF